MVSHQLAYRLQVGLYSSPRGTQIEHYEKLQVRNLERIGIRNPDPQE